MFASQFVQHLPTVFWRSLATRQHKANTAGMKRATSVYRKGIADVSRFDLLNTVTFPA
jgi:hypothetical protein